MVISSIRAVDGIFDKVPAAKMLKKRQLPLTILLTYYLRCEKM